MRTIWLVEDDFYLRESIRDAIKENGFSTNIIELTTEHEFCEKLKTVTDESNIPELVILDIMLPWTKPTRDMPEEPEEVKKNGFYRAGARCEKLFRAKQNLKDVPIIIYTNLQKDDIEDDLDWQSEKTYYLGKNGDLDDLKENINKFIYN